jgi:soluble lytic murein transglycosylase-like protein
MRVESNGDSRAVSSAGARGLMQIMPATWATLRARYGLGADPFDVRDNILAGAAYLRAMHDRYGDVTAMLAAYNAGPGRYDEYLSRGRPLPSETRAYLAKLAPMIGGAGDMQLAAASPPPDPFAWRRAALFVRTTSVAASASTASAHDDGATAETVVAAQMERGSGDSETAADTLFVHRAGAARPQ